MKNSIIRAFALFVMTSSAFALHNNSYYTVLGQTAPVTVFSDQPRFPRGTDLALNDQCVVVTAGEAGLASGPVWNDCGTCATLVQLNASTLVWKDKFGRFWLKSGGCVNRLRLKEVVQTSATTAPAQSTDSQVWSTIGQLGLEALQLLVQGVGQQYGCGSQQYAQVCEVARQCHPVEYRQLCQRQNFQQPTIQLNVTQVTQVTQTIHQTCQQHNCPVPPSCPPCPPPCTSTGTGATAGITPSTIPTGVTVASNTNTGTAPGGTATGPINSQTPYAVATGGVPTPGVATAATANTAVAKTTTATPATRAASAATATSSSPVTSASDAGTKVAKAAKTSATAATEPASATKVAKIQAPAASVKGTASAATGTSAAPAKASSFKIPAPAASSGVSRTASTGSPASFHIPAPAASASRPSASSSFVSNLSRGLGSVGNSRLNLATNGGSRSVGHR